MSLIQNDYEGQIRVPLVKISKSHFNRQSNREVAHKNFMKS
jgi:dUTPase